MPFNFLKRKKEPADGSTDKSTPDARAGRISAANQDPALPALPAAGRGRVESGVAPDQASAAGTPTGEGLAASKGGAARQTPSGKVTFDGLTEEWRLVGTMHIDGRLSDALNRRETIAISDVSWSPINGSEPFSPAPGLKSIDPYDLIAVLAGPDTLPGFTEEERAAHRVRKDRYDVAIEAPPFRILGQVHLHPGESPDRLIEQGAEMFIPLTDAVAYLNTQPVADPDVRVVLVNRLYIRGVESTAQ